MSVLSTEVKRFTDTLLGLPDSVLRQDWLGVPGEDDWREYTDNLSDVAYLIYQKLRAFTVTVHSDRAEHGPPITTAQRIIAQHQLAYRDFCGVMAGVRDEDLDETPFEGEWSLRSNLAHIMLAECWSQGPQIRHAIELRRTGREPAPIPARDALAESSVPADLGSLSELLASFDSRHDDLISTSADITDDELNTLSIYWEYEPVSIGFRLYRFAWHLRGHSLQADKIRVGIGHRMTDTQRLTRLLYSALGDGEGALVGAGSRQRELERACAESINSRANEVIALVHSPNRVPAKSDCA